MMQIEMSLDAAVALERGLRLPGGHPCAIGGYLQADRSTTASRASIFAHCPGEDRLPGEQWTRTGCSDSIRCDDPVLFLEHKHLPAGAKGPYPGGLRSLRKARRARDDHLRHHLRRP
jgi:pyruvate/2-oxoglutarate/acetoin dehydrogenase E1 component